jgi:acylphosphatase
VRRAAEDSGVAGWVRNRDDGAVEGVLEGDADALDRLLEMIRRGPGRAEVERLEVEDEQLQGLEGFRIV